MTPKQKISGLPLEEIRVLTLTDVEKIYQDGNFGLNRNSTVRYYARILNPELGTKYNSCQVCGYDKHIEICHIKAIASFSVEASLGEINRSENLLVLCPNHHWEFDSKLISIDEIPSRQCI